MPSKEQLHSNDKAVTKRQSSKPDIQSDAALDQQIQPDTVAQRARLDPRSLTPRDVLQLQRTIGNRAVGRLLAGTARRQPIDNGNNSAKQPLSAPKGENNAASSDALHSDIESLTGVASATDMMSEGAKRAPACPQVVQRYVLKSKAEEIEYRQLADQQDGKYGWTKASIAELLTWSRSMRQFRSILLNATCAEWRNIREIYAEGASLPHALKDINARVPEQARIWPTTLEKRAEYVGIPDLDRIANSILAVLYSTHHVEFKPRLEVTEEEVATERQSGKTGAKAALQAQIREAKFAREMGEEREHMGPDANIIPLREKDVRKGNVSDIGLYCVAVGVSDGTLYVAFNFKVTSYDEDSGLKFQRKLKESNTVSAKALENIRQDLVSLLAGTKFASMPIQFLRAMPSADLPAEEAHAPAHAEMQLLQVLQERLAAVGVSKPCCRHCTTVLGSGEVEFHSSHERGVANWLEPGKIQVAPYHTLDATRNVMTLRIPLNQLKDQEDKQQGLKSELSTKFDKAVTAFEVAQGVLTMTVNLGALGTKKDDFMGFIDGYKF